MPDEAVADRSYIKIFLRAETKRNVYKREGYDLLTFLGDLGGLADIIMLIGSSLTTVFSATMMKIALVSAIYKLRPKDKEDDST